MAEKKERVSRLGVKLRRYTAAERDAVLADVPLLEVTGAARKHGVPDANVSRWIKRFGLVRGDAQAPLSAMGAVSATPAPTSTASAIAVAAVATAEPEPKRPAVIAPNVVVNRPKSKRTARADKPSQKAAPSATKAPTIIEKTPPAKKIAFSYTPSQRAEALEYAAKSGVSEASEKFSISRFSIYDWRRKLTAAAAGLGPSPTSGPSAADIETRRDREILGEWKLHPGLGPVRSAINFAARA